MPQPSPTGQAPRPARRKGAAWAAAAPALVSFVVLVALLAGLPLLLWWGTSIVAPAGIHALGNLLTTQDSGEVFLLALAVAGWIGWALFTVSVLVEIPAQLRGHTAPRLRVLIGQKTAASLVGAILLALPTGTALASSAAPAQAATPTITATALPGTDTSSGQDQTVAAARRRRMPRTGPSPTPCAAPGRPRACGRSRRPTSGTATGGRRSPTSTTATP
jgi:hypothetical protein